MGSAGGATAEGRGSGPLPGKRQHFIASEPRPLRGHLLISHTHWDHIQGLPFFAPLFVPGNEWDIYAPRGLARSLRDTLAGQMQSTYFPVTLEHLAPRSATTIWSKAYSRPTVSACRRSICTIRL